MLLGKINRRKEHRLGVEPKGHHECEALSGE